MSRLLWMGVGAAGGIYVYRRGERAWERTKVRGVSGNATLLAATAAQWYGRLLAAQAQGDQVPPAGVESTARPRPGPGQRTGRATRSG